MSRFLNTKGRSTLAIGICARCQRKFSLEDLMDDGNSEGLKVCQDDYDNIDPYRLPLREADNTQVEFARPDEPLA